MSVPSLVFRANSGILAPSDSMAAAPIDISPDSSKLLNALPHPVLAVLPDGRIADANVAAEAFFGMSRTALWQHRLVHLLPIGSPLLSLIEQVRSRGAAINEYRVDLGLPRIEGLVDIFVSPLPDLDEGVVIMLQERSIADKMERQLTHRGAARSVAAMASMLAHEIKNPLSGIRGAAQLLETDANDNDRALTQLICEETDRIVKLVDRMSAFSDQRPIEREAVNIHVILDHVKKVAQAGFARHIRFVENYDPSLPPVLGNRDQLVQILLNLVKNAAEAIGEDRLDGEIELSTAFRPGVRLQLVGSKAPVSLPLEFCVRDNGAGVPEDVLPYLFDPFITTKATGTGLGLALVAKIIGDHGGIIECESHPHRTTFRVLMPMSASLDGRGTARG
ncbi:two-component system sensor histidine kinase NtrB [Beijerinckia indica]|uniref:histidine kinase n=1 Tax=Beijerinckia indica subsp. indica (strain ATCC 9039 / DSM 1715 / NCIMB 8712) TaxID=395963 RepID=B2IB67_BEII9|nr:signal transduction histidine kinase, nitrogen specific, NtrB [Beijerinckia indica subsp. indica ATCC 9039]